MALREEAEGRLCELGRFGPVVLALGCVALDLGAGRLRLLVERGAGLGLLQRWVPVPGRQDLLHTLLQKLHVHLVTVLLQRGIRKLIRLHCHVISSNNGSALNPGCDSDRY